MNKSKVLNCTPHSINMLNQDTHEIVVLERNSTFIRANQAYGSIRDSVSGIKTVLAGEYTLDLDTMPEISDEIEVLIVSTIVAQFADEIRKYYGRPIRIVVSDSGPSSVTYKIGSNTIILCNKFLEYI